MSQSLLDILTDVRQSPVARETLVSARSRVQASHIVRARKPRPYGLMVL